MEAYNIPQLLRMEWIKKQLYDRRAVLVIRSKPGRGLHKVVIWPPGLLEPIRVEKPTEFQALDEAFAEYIRFKATETNGQKT